jgi:mannose-6-phosphate isomerase-like protein (cupin superfamily)
MTISAAEALGLLPEEQKERSLLLWEHASLQVELYAPRGADLQRPHARDEIYVVIRGRGDFLSWDERRPIGPGDFIFVEAEVPHRFENFSDDLTLWVFFYGPEGGEAERT